MTWKKKRTDSGEKQGSSMGLEITQKPAEGGKKREKVTLNVRG